MSDQLNALIESQLMWRYATKRFDSIKKISPEDMRTLQEALRLSPSSFGLQPWKFFVITTPALREQLKPHSWNQPQITEASHLVVLASKKNIEHKDIDSFISFVSETRGVSADKLGDYAAIIKSFIDTQNSHGTTEAWATRQVYLALGVLLSTAAMLNIDACPLEGLDPAMYDQILGLDKQGYATRVACALGYRSPDDASSAMTKVRYPHQAIIQEL